ncbi:BLUF domain-containing protein [Brevundimonas sp.]
MTQPLVSLAYKSRSTAPVIDPKTLASILVVAQRNNVDNHLTGALAYGDGHFIQVLEGPEDLLLKTMERIRVDVRHKRLDVIGPSPIGRRMFPDWCMALLSVEPSLQPVFSALVADWTALGPRAAALLATTLQD